MDMHKSIQFALSRKRLGIRTLHEWKITGTERLKDGGTDIEICTEHAYTRDEAWEQAKEHAAGTNFTPERVELVRQ